MENLVTILIDHIF